MAKQVSGLAAPQRFSMRPTKKLCTIMGAASGGVLALCGGLYYWQSQELESKARIIQEKIHQVEHGEEVAKRLGDTRRNFDETNQQLRNLENSVAPNAYVPTMLEQIEVLATSVNLTVTRFSPRVEPAPPPPTKEEERKTWKPQPYDKVIVEMTVKGTYWRVAEFLLRLTRFQKIIAVSTIQQKPESELEVGKSPNLSVDIKMTGFAFLADGAKTEDPAQGGALKQATGSASANRRAENEVISAAGQAGGKR